MPASTTAARGIPALRDARREMYRRQILTAAEVEFGRSGFAHAKVSSIAKTAGLSLATVYKHFSGKGEIWDDLHADRMAELLARAEARGRDAAPGLDRLLASAAEVALYLADNDAYLDMNLKVGSGWASGAAAAHGVQQSVWSAGLETIAAGVERAIARGEVATIKPNVAAGMVVSALQVWLADWAQSGRREDPAQVVEEMTERLTWMLRAGTAAGSS